MKRISSFTLLLFCFTLLLSCKNDEIASQEQLSGKWNLVSIDSDFKTALGNSLEKYDFAGKGGYIDFQDDAYALSNLVMSDDITELLVIGKPTTSWKPTYMKFVNSIMIEVYDTEYKKLIPVDYEIKSLKNGNLVLVVTTEALKKVMKKYDELDGTPDYSNFFSLVTSAEITLTFTR